jgi:hypothetical protein
MDLADPPAAGALSGSRRSFIKGIAAAGASTAVALTADAAGLDLLGEDAAAQAGLNDFSSFRAIAPSSADALSVPEGYRADVIIRYGDPFTTADGETLTYGYNNDFLAFFPLPAGSERSDEGLLFVNHEYPGPFLQHGQPDPVRKSVAQVELERGSVGNSIVHVRRDGEGVFRVVPSSPYHRRITGADPVAEFTGPLAEDAAYPGIGRTAQGSLANCSGGITPWGTALSCEENYQDYGNQGARGYGWTPERVGTADYFNGNGRAAAPAVPDTGFRETDLKPDGPAKYGWVVETDPYDPSYRPRKHTALGRFRHENTAFRADPGRPFVLYMGDDVQNGGVYKFVSDLPFRPGRRDENRRILESGTLYVARWEPEGRRRFATAGDTTPLTATEGTGTWRRVEADELVDTQAIIRSRVGAAEFDLHFATNRPEDLEVDEDGTVFIALTNNSTVRDTFGSVRTLTETGGDPAATSFTWRDYAAGGPSGRATAGEEGFASPDNLAFDREGNLWVVTDISSSALNQPGPNQFHANNAVFMIPMRPGGQRADVAFRFANAPVEAEATGPYFTPDERTLFLNIQHPGEESDAGGGNPDDNASQTAGLSSYWPRGNRTTGQNPSKPLPSMVAITKLAPAATPPSPTPNVIPPPPPGLTPEGTPAPRRPDRTLPELSLTSPARQALARLRGRRGLEFRLTVSEPVRLRATLVGRLSRRRGGRGAERRLARSTVRVTEPGTVTLRLRPNAALRALLRREDRLPAALLIRAEDAAGNVRTRRKRLDFS